MNDAVSDSYVLSFLLNFRDIDLFDVADMLYVSASARAAWIILNKFQHSQRCAFGDVGWYTASIDKLLTSLLIGAHFLKDSHLCWSLRDDLRALLVKSCDKWISLVSVNSTDVLDIGTRSKMIALAWLQVGASSLAHCHIK